MTDGGDDDDDAPANVMRSIVPQEAAIETFAGDAPGAPPVRGVIHRPATPPRESLVLAHGAGGNRDAPILVAVARAFAAAGLLVLRCDLPFRQERPAGPPFPAGAARDREGLRAAIAAVRRLAPGRAFLGGHSYGGRQASVLAAADSSVTDALLLLAYPLHPPRRPSALRTEHFPRIRVPALFVLGSRDPFGSPAELDAARRVIPAPTSLLMVDGGGHDLGISGRPGGADPAVRVAGEILAGFRALVG